MKKTLALVLAAVMVLALLGAALADLPTAQVTITGLEDGDQVKLYKVIEWKDGNWSVTSEYISAYTTSEYNIMTADLANAIAAISKNDTPVETGFASGDTFTASGLEPGMYLAIVTSAAGTTIYNPMVVSVNFAGENAASGELSIDSESVIGYPEEYLSAVAKKQDIPFDKEVDEDETDDPDNCETVQPGDVIPFKITTKLPSYDAPYTAPIFRISDTLSAGIKLNQDSLTVKVGGVDVTTDADVIDTAKTVKEDQNWSITFNPTYLMRDGAVEDVEITYTATVQPLGENPANVTRFNNSAKLEYSNNPENDEDVKKVFDDTNHYTFSIDAKADGLNEGRSITSELIKIGVDDAGEEDKTWKVTGTSEWATSNKLAEAVFTLTKTAPVPPSYTSEYTTTDSGHISFYGLEEGTYELVETAAPAGYVKDNSTVTVEISATMKKEERTQEGYTYEVEVLDTYTITIDGKATSTYSVTNYASDFGTVTTLDATSNDTFPFVNTKGLELPSTGGIGTTIFYVAGLLMVLGAATVLVARRKADAE